MSFVERPRSQIREREEVGDRLMELRHRIAHLERVEAGLPQEALETDIAARLRASLVHDDLVRARKEFDELSPYARAFAPAAERPVERHPTAPVVDPTDEVVEIELPALRGRSRSPERQFSDCAAADITARASIDLIRMRALEANPAPQSKVAKMSAVVLPFGRAMIRVVVPDKISGRVLTGAAGFLLFVGVVGATALVGQPSSEPPAGGSVALVQDGDAGDMLAMLPDDSSAQDEGAQDQSGAARLVAGLQSTGVISVPMRWAPSATAAIRRVLGAGEQVELMASRAMSGGLAWRQVRSHGEVGWIQDDAVDPAR